ncbi:hypothetical protein [Maribacter sp. ACAM166]|uniref:hypothetical protein n=1 Tax=Maribacter sp. ACAM166 TaxID=2508996 RepID=UPI0010FDDA4C|nr:hypothetical protein [Maribacter sp. ACAM166]TLP80622.1 hypothetical protein ES765_07595 [Maribacter sp. ACAM166]
MRQLVVIVMLLFTYWNGKIDSSTYIGVIEHQDSLKVNAFIVLKNHCNSCHKIKRKASVFTLKNMTRYSNAINQQVFIKRRMPKGRTNRLAKTQEETLKIWLSSLKNP